MDPLKEGIAGFCKPLLDLIFSVLIYAFTQIFITLQSVEATLPKSSASFDVLGFAANPLLFLTIFSIVAVLEEILWGANEGYYEPTSAVAKSLGVLLGTFVFWDAIVHTQNIIGGSEFDVILSGLVSIVPMILGIYLRFKISEGK